MILGLCLDPVVDVSEPLPVVVMVKGTKGFIPGINGLQFVDHVFGCVGALDYIVRVNSRNVGVLPDDRVNLVVVLATGLLLKEFLSLFLGLRILECHLGVLKLKFEVNVNLIIKFKNSSLKKHEL